MRPFEFFRTIFGNSRGFVSIAVKRKTGEFRETYYRYPDQLRDMHEFVERSKWHGDVYFCAQLLSEPKRTKANVVAATCAWADLDTCHPRTVLVRPTIAIETSPNRYQAFWVFDEARDPLDGENLARRIAYHHANEGADRSGWDLTQLLRIPGTRNFKYGEGASAPVVTIVENTGGKYRLTDFAEYPDAEGYEYLSIPFPQLTIEDGAKILERYSYKVSGAAASLFHEEPNAETDRSAAIYRLNMLCFESGMSREEVYQVARDSKVNKWLDKPHLLWQDVCRASATHGANLKMGQAPPSHEPSLVTDAEIKDLQATPGFVERYIAWAKTLGDAAVQYHEAGALVALSSLMAGSVVLPTSFGALIPNLWICILADTTITRKSTAMGITMDLIEEIDDTLLMATDGSIEGLTTALAGRPGQVSIFFRDEFTGLIEQMTKKDYMAGMPEFFTNLYDGRTQLRRLRKEEVRVKNPRLVIFAGGIKSRMQSLVTFEHVSSGFLPRFIFITAETDPNKVKPLGPPTDRDWGVRDTIKNELTEIGQHYKSQIPITRNGKVIGVQDKLTEATLTRDAWARFNRIDQTMMQIGLDSGDLSAIMTPMYARLGFSMLKAAVLMAAARQRGAGIVVEEEDIIRAAWYGDSWRRYSQDVIVNVGKGPLEHKIQLVANAVQRQERCTRSMLMQHYHLNANEMSLIARTLEERGLVTLTQHGRQQVFQSTLTEGEKVLAK
jgi:hypothetical protein